MDESNMTVAIDAFQKLHLGQEITQDQLQMVKDVVCGNSLFSNILMDDKCFWTLLNSTLDNIHDNYENVLSTFVGKAFCMSYGLRFNQSIVDEMIANKTQTTDTTDQSTDTTQPTV